MKGGMEDSLRIVPRNRELVEIAVAVTMFIVLLS
jgi:hypothetical protein